MIVIIKITTLRFDLTIFSGFFKNTNFFERDINLFLINANYDLNVARLNYVHKKLWLADHLISLSGNGFLSIHNCIINQLSVSRRHPSFQSRKWPFVANPIFPSRPEFLRPLNSNRSLSPVSCHYSYRRIKAWKIGSAVSLSGSAIRFGDQVRWPKFWWQIRDF